MVMLYPHQRASNQEILYLVVAVIKNFRTPVRVLPHPWIRIFVQSLAVKFGKPVRVPREMRRHPVQDYADIVFMEVIDHPCKILRRTVPGRRRIISGYLIAPGAVKRIFGYPHQFYMGIPHFFYIIRKRPRHLAVCIKPAVLFVARMAHPGSRVHLINTHRLLIHCFTCLAFFHPRIVRPFKMVDIYNTRRRPRPHFRKIRIWIRLIKLAPVGRFDEILIKAACPKPRDKQLINACRFRFQAF